VTQPKNIIAASLIGKFITRAFLLLLLVGAHGTAFSNQMLFSEKVLFVKSHDPREISFVYEDGSKLRGVYSGISWDAVWDLSTASGSQWFNVNYDADNGLILNHLSRDIQFKLVGQVDNHPLKRLLSLCLKRAGGSSIGRNRCLNAHDRLIDVEIERAYKLLENAGEDIADLRKAWKNFSSHQYSYIRQLYSKFQGSKWAYISMEDVVEIDETHLDMLNNWIGRLLSNRPDLSDIE